MRNDFSASAMNFQYSMLYKKSLSKNEKYVTYYQKCMQMRGVHSMQDNFMFKKHINVRMFF